MANFSRDGVTILEGSCLDLLPTLPADSVDCCVTSPPYWGLRDYGAEGQLGLEPTPEEYVSKMVDVFREVRRVLKPEGTLWLNLGDTYNAYNGGAGPSSSLSRGAQTKERPQLESGYGLRSKSLKPKDLVGIPWMVAFALRADGWYLRSDIIWHKPNPMPESTKDRPTKAHEYVFLLSKSRKYHYDADAIAEACIESNDARPRMGQGPNTQYAQKRKKMKMPDGWDTGEGGHGSFHRNGREKGKADNADAPDKKNKRTVWTVETDRQLFDWLANNSPELLEKFIEESGLKKDVWTVPTEPYPEAHFATFPTKLIEPCILAGCPMGGTVLDPFTGSGTTAAVAQKNGCKFIGCEVNPEYIKLAAKRFRQRSLLTSKD